jgi:hypothetical protein
VIGLNLAGPLDIERMFVYNEISKDTSGNIHHIKAIPEHGGRFLRVVVNPHVQPGRIVTLFFDRRLGRQR